MTNQNQHVGSFLDGDLGQGIKWVVEQIVIKGIWPGGTHYAHRLSTQLVVLELDQLRGGGLC